ncbi:MAG: 30S ribosomal protein S9 [Phycisphaerales bacterium]|nr:30S ribosomal protein S9 [Planctomycetota bacterium]
MTTTQSGLNIPAGLSSTAVAPAAAQIVRPVRAAQPADRHGWWWGTGRRKTAVARVRLKPAKGESGVLFEVERTSKAGKKDPKNEKRVTKTVEQYFSEVRDRNDVLEPIKVASLQDKILVVFRCHGGGTMGQAQACKLAIARALLDYDPTLEARFRELGLLTRDSREVERKKYGQAGARRRFQFSKR